jgi:hypothetical protein
VSAHPEGEAWARETLAYIEGFAESVGVPIAEPVAKVIYDRLAAALLRSGGQDATLPDEPSEAAFDAAADAAGT